MKITCNRCAKLACLKPFCVPVCFIPIGNGFESLHEIDPGKKLLQGKGSVRS